MGTAYTQENLYQIEKRLCRNRLTVNLHIRRGDFFPTEGSRIRGAERTMLPLIWYTGLCEKLVHAIGRQHLQFVICSDGSTEEIDHVLSLTNGIHASALPNSDVSDLLTCSRSDILICSISSFSMWAAFLGEPLYLWYRDNLVPEGNRLVNRFVRDQGCYAPLTGGGSSVRGYAIDLEEELPDEFLASARLRLSQKNALSDLVRGGGI